jgi:hypothetical protein
MGLGRQVIDVETRQSVPRELEQVVDRAPAPNREYVGYDRRRGFPVPDAIAQRGNVLDAVDEPGSMEGKTPISADLQELGESRGGVVPVHDLLGWTGDDAGLPSSTAWAIRG